MASTPQIRIGISGWTYAPWRGVFYPKKFPQKRELEYASRRLNSIEINGSFYSLQRPSTYRAWYESTPENFVFSVKGGRFITHIRRLKQVETPLANFLASGLLGLRRSTRNGRIAPAEQKSARRARPFTLAGSEENQMTVIQKYSKESECRFVGILVNI